MFWFKKNNDEYRKKAVKQQIVWFEIPALDFYRAITFYKKVFGFTINVMDFNGIKHGIFSFSEGQTTGAIIEIGEKEIKGGSVLFFDGNPSISDFEKKIISSGGQILLNKTLIKNQTSSHSSVIPNNFIDGKSIGYFAYFLDTEGNKMGLYGNS